MKAITPVSRFLLGFFSCAVLVACWQQAQQPVQAQSPSAANAAPLVALPDFSALVERTTPAVVSIEASSDRSGDKGQQSASPGSEEEQMQEFFRRFFGQPMPGQPGPQGPRGGTSFGSGFIISSDGYVLTNHHVIEGMTNVKVALADRREFDAEIVLRDPRTDLAVLRIRNGGTFPAMEVGDSDNLEVGDIVLALGNPFGVGQTVTQGIVSALARTQVGITDYGFFIQTDAAINPGNSGGALVDMQGRLVGVNTAIFSKSGGSIGIGFAIPVNMVKIVVAAAKGGVRQVRRPWLGATLQPVSREIADSLGMDRPAGALVSDVIARGPAEDAGLQRGDVITAVDGVSIDDPEGLGYRMGVRPLGGMMRLSVLRRSRPVSLDVKLMAAPEMPPREEIVLQGRSPFAGATIVNASPATMEELSVEGVKEGVIIAEIQPGTSAAAVGLQRGDVILAINDQRMARTADLRAATANRQMYWKLTLLRGGQVITTVLGG